MLNITEDLKSNDADRFFDNICDKEGNKLVKSAKRSMLRVLMREMYYMHPEQNICKLKDGREVPIIIAKKHPKRGLFCYFNTSAAPTEEILRTFAEKVNITCKFTRPEPKKESELIVSDIKHLMDNVMVEGKKVSDFKKQEQLNMLFQQLYDTPKDNICHTKDGKEIPIIVERLSINNWNTLCLNTSEHHTEVLAAFAAFAGCTYCQEKENAVPLPERIKTEMTARECARIFHGVPNFDGSMTKRDASPKLVEWFGQIYNKPSLNKTILPDGTDVPLLVYRISCAQKCLCLNTSDESVKPFVIKRMAEITEANICLDNLKIHTDNIPALCKAVKSLALASSKTENLKEIAYYEAYANKVFEAMSPNAKEFNAQEWLINQSKKGKE
ncbi:MAG: hypothetical protein NC218_11585 [Acetobacter sp.]|nr:hypothetical protein [Acetobacter sp.]